MTAIGTTRLAQRRGQARPRRRRAAAASLALLLVLLAPGRPVHSQDASRPAPQPSPDGPAVAYETETRLTIRDDRTSLVLHTVTVRLLKEAALQTAGQQTVGYVEGMETLEVVEAATLKADGRRVTVAPETILTRDAASGLSAVYLRDAKSKTLIFPDIAVGDTLKYTIRRDVRQTSFEGHFTYSSVIPRTSTWLRAVHTIEAPLTLTLNFAHRGDGITHATEDAGASVRHRIAYERPADPAREEPGAVAPSDREPSFVLTTFKSYDELGAVYWKDASIRSAVTPAIQALADDIARGLPDKRAQAEAIDRWMKRHIRYVAVYLGRQRWIANPAETVLANRYGDCKDMTALMSALLAARGIASEHALLNLGNAYTLALLPPGAINHVLIHLPELGIFTDPTDALAAFGVLSTQTYDKPALLVAAQGTRRAQTPPMRPEDHVTIARTRARIAADGSVTGETVQTATGMFAASARKAFLGMQSSGVERSAERILNGLQTPGTGRFEASSPSELKEPYAISASFTLNDRFVLPLSGNRRMPIGLPVHSRPGTFLLGPRVSGRKEPFSCYAGRQVEDLEIEFAAGLPMPRKPQPYTVATSVFAYKATYDIIDRTFKVRREFTSRVASQNCLPSVETEIAEPLRTVLASVGSVLVFGRPSQGTPGSLNDATTGDAPGRAEQKK